MISHATRATRWYLASTLDVATITYLPFQVIRFPPRAQYFEVEHLPIEGPNQIESVYLSSLVFPLFSYNNSFISAPLMHLIIQIIAS